MRFSAAAASFISILNWPSARAAGEPPHGADDAGEIAERHLHHSRCARPAISSTPASAKTAEDFERRHRAGAVARQLHRDLAARFRRHYRPARFLSALHAHTS